MVDEKGLRKSTILNISNPQVYDNIFYSEDVCDKRSSVRDELAYSGASRYFYTTKERDTLNDPSGEILNSIEKRIGDSFAKQDFMKTLGAELATVRSGFVEIRLPIRSGLLQQDGFVHAGVISSIADSAAGYAAMSLLDEGREVLTAEFKINLLAPARGEYLIARAKVLRSGKRLSVSSCDVFAISEGKEDCVATLLGTISNR